MDAFSNPIWQLNLPPDEKGQSTTILVGPGVDTSGETSYPYTAVNFLDIGADIPELPGEVATGVIYGVPFGGSLGMNIPNPIATWALGDPAWAAVESKIQLAYTQSGYRKNMLEQWNEGVINPAPPPFGASEG